MTYTCDANKNKTSESITGVMSGYGFTAGGQNVATDVKGNITAHFYHRNHQYSVTAITTSTGAIAERYAYTAYGQPTILNASGTPLSPQTSTLNSRYSYTGREWDATLGLHHFRARWMSPSAGRFLGRDPIGYKGSPFDLYEYVKGHPLVERDPMGLDRCTDLCDAAAATCFVLATAACINAALHCHILLFCPPLDDFARRTSENRVLNKSMRRRSDVFDHSMHRFYYFASDFFALGAELHRERAG